MYFKAMNKILTLFHTGDCTKYYYQVCSEDPNAGDPLFYSNENQEKTVWTTKAEVGPL